MQTRISLRLLGGTADRMDPTGSCTLISIQRGDKKPYNILGDYGLFQVGSLLDRYYKNKKFVSHVDVSKLDAVFFTHVHLDHTGNGPRLLHQGFGGRIICTTPTADLLYPMYIDSANIQEKQMDEMLAEYEERYPQPHRHRNDGRKNFPGRDGHNWRPKNYPIEPLYSTDDVKEFMRLVDNGGYAYEQQIELADGVYLTFYNSAHILGGAVCQIAVRTSDVKDNYYYMTFTGDLGRKEEDQRIFPPPVIPAHPSNYLQIESTYGGKTHAPRDEEDRKIIEMINQTIANRGKVIFCTYALKTQNLVYWLSWLAKNRRIPAVPIHVDSPLALNATERFSPYWNSADFIQVRYPVGFNTFNAKDNPYVALYRPVYSLARAPGPYVATVCNGSCTAGNSVKYLAANIGDPKNLIFLDGYMFRGTTGAELAKGANFIKIGGENREVKAKIYHIKGSSLHATGKELTNYAVESIDHEDPRGIIAVVHGENNGSMVMKSDISQRLGSRWDDRVIIPKLGDRIDLL